MKRNYFASWEDLTSGYEDVYLPLYIVSTDDGKTVDMVLGRFFDETEDMETLEEACISMGNYIIGCQTSKEMIELVYRRINSVKESLDEKNELDAMEASVAAGEKRKLFRHEMPPKKGSYENARENLNMVCGVCKQHDSMRKFGRARMVLFIFMIAIVMIAVILLVLGILHVLELQVLTDCRILIVFFLLLAICSWAVKAVSENEVVKYWRCPYCREALPTYQRRLPRWGGAARAYRMLNFMTGHTGEGSYGYIRMPVYVDTCPYCKRRIDHQNCSGI